MSLAQWDNYPGSDDMLSQAPTLSPIIRGRMEERKWENQCWDPSQPQVNHPQKHYYPDFRSQEEPDIDAHVSGAVRHVSTCRALCVGPLPIWELITGLLWVKWAPVIITMEGINHGSRVTIDTFYRCLNITIMCQERESKSQLLAMGDDCQFVTGPD